MLATLSLLLLLLGLAGVGAGAAVSGYLGRTPSELIDYAKRRLQGHPKLEAVALPVLNALRSQVAEQDAAELALPFVAPARPPNAQRTDAAVGVDDPRIIRVGPGRAVSRIGVAARMAVDGSIIEIDPGDYIADAAVWDRADLTIRGRGDRVRLIAAGANAEGKAIWVFRSERARVENIEFVGARVGDGNGAGIRLESGQLAVRRCTFWDNENGILTSSDPAARLDIESSEFGYNGAGDGLSHGIYVGAIASFRLVASYVHHGNVGHLVKSRAQTNRIEYNRLSDEIGGRSSYELELPNGGVAEVVGNIVQQGTGSRNSTIVSYGAEGYRWPRNELRFVHNTVVNDQRFGGTFLRVWPGAGAVLLRNNLFVGAGKVDGSALADAAGDREAEWSDLVRPAREDYRVNAEARARWASERLAPVPADLQPHAEYVHPLGRRPLAAPPALPGALQSLP